MRRLDAPSGPRIKGAASAAGTQRYAARFAVAFATFRGLRLSRVGLGTSLGAALPAGDRFRTSAYAAFTHGINVADTAISYGAQTCERAIGQSLRDAFRAEILARDEIFVVSKCGYLPYSPRDTVVAPRYSLSRRRRRSGANQTFHSTYCMDPAFITDQIELSRSNLGLQTIDLYLLHNPEVQAANMSKSQFECRIGAAFETLERACADGRIAFFGISSWDAFRCNPDAPAHLDLLRLRKISVDVGGPKNRFAAIEAPYNALCPEIATKRTQLRTKKRATLLEIADREGMLVLTSATLAGGLLAVPGVLSRGPDYAKTCAQKAIDFSCSTFGVTSALVGMRSRAHVKEAVHVITALASQSDGGMTK
ncbi:MAG: aldo/keto reductase [Xanthobacteraceae bacterium]